MDSGLPHSAQNFLTPALSVPHFEQRIESPEDEANSPSSIPEAGKRPTGLMVQQGIEDIRLLFSE
jgi:hypothetical protein